MLSSIVSIFSVLCSIAWILCALRGTDFLILRSPCEMLQMECRHVGNFLCYFRPFYDKNSASKMSQMESAQFGKFLAHLHLDFHQRVVTDGMQSPCSFLVELTSFFFLLGIWMVLCCIVLYCSCDGKVMETVSSRIGRDVSTLWCGRSRCIWSLYCIVLLMCWENTSCMEQFSAGGSH